MHDHGAHLPDGSACRRQAELVGAFERQRPDRKDASPASSECGVGLVTRHARQRWHVERLVHTLELVGQPGGPETVLGLVEDLVANVNGLAAGNSSRDQSPASGVASRASRRVQREGDSDSRSSRDGEQLFVAPHQPEEDAEHRADQHPETGASQHVVILRGDGVRRCRRRSLPTPARCARRAARPRSSTRCGDRTPARSGS